MTPKETEMLARHLGHDVATHKEWYRLAHSTIELTKVSAVIIKAPPPTRGRLLVFVRFRPPARMDTASHPCHPDKYKTAFSIHLVFNILDARIIT